MKNINKRFTRDDFELSLIALPTFIWFILFSYIPMFGVLIPFKSLKLTGKGFFDSFINSPWVGLKNFEFILLSNDLKILLRNTLGYNALFICLGIIIPVTLAIMLSELLNKTYAKVCQTMMFLPFFLSWVVISYFVFAFLSPDKGLINQLLTILGKDTVMWYMESKYWPFILTFMNLWKNIGYGMVVYLAAISGIDKTYYEAAVIDGANKWQQIRCITLPFLRSIIVIMFILSLGRILNADFGLFFQIPRESGSLFNVTNVIDTYVYRSLMVLGNFNMSAATAFLQSIVGCIMVICSNFIVRKVDPENSLF